MKQALWDTFCRRFNVVGGCVPLFAVDDHNNVEVKKIGKAQRMGLVRSQGCESMIMAVADQLVPDWTSGTKRFDGMLYMMGRKQSGSFVLLYIGKTESTGRGGGLSLNITNLRTDKSKGSAARTGDSFSHAA